MQNKSLIQAFGLGWVVGFIAFVGQIYWLNIFHFSIPIILSAYLALYFGLFCLVYQFREKKTPTSDLVIIPIIWVAVEYLRSIGSWGFSAGLLGYSQHQNLFLIQIADVIGVFGISFLIAFINASLFSVIKDFSLNRTIKVLSVMIIVMALVFVYGGIKMTHAEISRDLKVALIQPNFDYSAKGKYDFNNAIATLDELTTQAAKEKPDLIIWPETVIKESVRLNLAASRKINDIVKKNGSYLLFGNPDVKKTNGKVKHYNSAFLVSPQGKVVKQYNKIHPVPFWEIIPIRYYFPFLRNTEAKGTCERGDEFIVFDIPKGRFSTLICFEGIFPDL
ncbi:MAG: apolipoprotein N-acyltransferase, partial [Candidatus Kryptoniota bacterium]